MSRLLIAGRQRLEGEVSVQGAKNSALPIIAATLLTKGENVIFNCPRLSDVEASCAILRYLGGKAQRSDGALLINCDGVNQSEIPDSLMRRTRSSIVFLGAVLARTGRARLSFPGGCEIGPRPIDMHLKALRELGAEIEEKHGVLECRAPYGLRGAKIALSFPSVGATEDVMIAAALAGGTTTISNAAREPEIRDLADYLNKCGAEIYGAGEGVIVIEGVSSLHSAAHTIIPDRIVAATLMSCAAVTGSEIVLRDAVASHLGAVIPVLEEGGCRVNLTDRDIRLKAPKRLRSMRIVRTMPYPGFPTDAQAPLMAAACAADGTTVFIENIFENRYRHIPELARMGAAVKTEGKVAVVEGVPRLYGAAVEATDLRGAAALVTAALCAEGSTSIGGVRYLERGYEDFDLVLSSLGADIKKV
ncbi:MAG: UDP-N-acetylglucosamine 1-carboxyvinyltransferase [Ruminococcus sp.]|nr:UDP-N-acetylglucosamine 1-carboxyvinyltransferase [Ruminococcus sp.]